MSMVETLILVAHLLVAIGICGFVLLQHGKGADMGAAFGSGSSGSLFGAAGSANFLSRTTAILAAVFFATSLGLTCFGTTHAGRADAAGRDAAGRRAEHAPHRRRRMQSAGSAPPRRSGTRRAPPAPAIQGGDVPK